MYVWEKGGGGGERVMAYLSVVLPASSPVSSNVEPALHARSEQVIDPHAAAAAVNRHAPRSTPIRWNESVWKCTLLNLPVVLPPKNAALP